ncbi:hypothetical protein [uncultured Maricaulis sp.]|uniref:hypothetical protein n=1 Tax=uncultured Maricaulis sp. TaxID=174710 RepID=UPI0030D725DA|tara:strand:- start:133675 stop:133884 length:210 start_codon:yes stop_codon:yes gene_type:complete
MDPYLVVFMVTFALLASGLGVAAAIFSNVGRPTDWVDYALVIVVSAVIAAVFAGGARACIWLWSMLFGG